MKLRKLGAFISAGVLLSVHGLVAAGQFDKEGSSYVGAGIGFSDYTFWEGPTVHPNQNRTVSTENSAMTYGFNLGYNVRNNISVELFFQDFGDVEFQDQQSIVIGSNTITYEDEVEGSISGFGLVAKGYLPVGDRLDFYGKAGFMFWEFESSVTSTEYENGVLTVGPDRYSFPSLSETDPYVALGVEFELFTNFSLYGDVGYLHGSYRDENVHVFAYMAGFTYRYGRATKYRHNDSDNRSRPITACDPKYKDVAGLICGE